MIVVEHLLLRPKFIGDAVYPACCDAGCSTCGNEDPYSFRLTFVMPGWTEQYTDNLDLRVFAGVKSIVDQFLENDERPFK